MHRDIKPSNILVDDDGRVKLLDFGIAKLLEGNDPEHTDVGGRVLTPDYASPEQRRGEAVTTSTDVYQLGLLLRELLTGLSPSAVPPDPGRTSQLSRSARLEIAGTLSAVARAAARRTTPADLAKALTGDLDLIAGRALRAEPEARYASADELAADVRRHLRGRPVHAHPESTLYRVRKYAGRHPLFLPALAATVVGIAGFVILLSVQNRRIARQRDAAVAATRRAQATQDFLVGLLRSPDPTVGAQQRDITVIEAMQRGRARVDSELGAEPALRAAVLEAIGRTLTGLGYYELADTLLRQSLAWHQTRAGPADSATARLLGAVGQNFRSARQYVAADSFLHQQLAVRLAAGEVDDSTLAGLLTGLSFVRRDLGDVDSAAALAVRAIALRRSAGDTLGADFTGALAGLGYALRGANQLDSAAAVYREVLARTIGDSGVSVPDRAVAHNNLAYVLRLKEDYAGAEAAYREARRLLVDALGAGHPTTLTVSANLAATLELAGRTAEAAEVGRARIAAAEHQWPKGHWRVGEAQLALGRFLLRQGRFAEAISPLEAGAQVYLTQLGPDHSWTAEAFANVGAAMLLAGRSAEGRSWLGRAHRVLADHPGPLGADQRLNIGRMADVLAAGGHPELAARYRALLNRR